MEAAFIDDQVGVGRIVYGVYDYFYKYFFNPTEIEPATVIASIDDFIEKKYEDFPSYLERGFSNNASTERGAAHNVWIRIFINESSIIRELQEIIENMSFEERMIGLAYLTGIDQGMKKANTLYPKYAELVEPFVAEFIAKADAKDEAYNKVTPVSTDAVRTEPGVHMRPLDRHRLREFTPKFRYHPITALTLAEFRRNLFPKKQEYVDSRFHGFNMESRNGLILSMEQGKKTVSKESLGTVTSYENEVQLEFYVNGTATLAPNYLGYIQDEGTLTTSGKVSKYQLTNGQVRYLINYTDFKIIPYMSKYIVSDIIPIGAVGETYQANLDLEKAIDILTDINKS